MSTCWFPVPRRGKATRKSAAAARTRANQLRRRLVVESMEERIVLSSSIPLLSSVWTPLGPAPIVNGETPGNQVVSGKVTGIATNPTDTNTIYVSTAGGGVWKTIDGGTNWASLTDNQVTLFTGSIAVAPSAPNTIYAGTGVADNTFDSYAGFGVLKSTDGGATWAQFDDGGKFDGDAITNVVVDPTNPNTVYVAVSATAQNSGLNFNAGIYKSTNGGLSWSNTTQSISPFDDYSALVIDPKTPTNLYMAVGTANGAIPNGVYASTDAGGTWNLLKSIPNGVNDGRIALALAPANGPASPQTLYVSIAAAGAGSPPPVALGNLLKFGKTTDGGATFTDLTASVPNYMGNGTVGFGNIDQSLAVDPANAKHVIAGSGNVPGTSGDLVESLDGGITWTSITQGANGNGPHGGHHAGIFNSSGIYLDGDDGGIFRLDNANPAALQWSDLNGNLNITQFNGIALDPTTLNVAYGGSSGTGTEQFNDTLAWNELRGGGGGDVLVNPVTPTTIFHTFPFAHGADFIERSDNGGQTWAPKTTGIALTDTSNTFTPLVMDPSNPARLLVGTDNVYESTNNGDSWTVIGGPGSSGWNSPATTMIDSIVIAPSDPNTIYVSTSSSTSFSLAQHKVYVTHNDGATWVENDISTAGNSNVSVPQIVVDPSNPLIAYAVQNRPTFFGGGHAFETQNGGATWTDISGFTGFSTAGPNPLPNIPARSIVLDTTPGAPRIFVGTDAGVYVSTDGGQDWSKFMTGLPNVQVTSLVLDTNLNVLAAGTHGRGLYEIKAVNPIVVTSSTLPNAVEGTALGSTIVATFTAGSNPGPASNFNATINWGDKTGTTTGVITTDGSGTFFVTADHTYHEEGTYTVTITVGDNTGDSTPSTATIVVGDARLTQVGTIAVTSTEGANFRGPVATFLDQNPFGTTADFTATITWGNGVTSAGTVTPDPTVTGQFIVTGTTTFAEEGKFTTSVLIVDDGGRRLTATGTSTVADAALTATARTISGVEGAPVNKVLATFVDADPAGALGDYTATIDWGDGTTSTAGTIASVGGGTFSVTGSHTYLEQNSQGTSYTVSVTIFDASTSTSVNDTVVINDAPLTPTPVTVGGSEGLSLAGSVGGSIVIGTFSDANPNATAAEFAPVTIDWGDGTSAGTILSLGGGIFSVSGNHTYAEEGNYPITAVITDVSNGRLITDTTDSTATISSTAQVSDASLTATAAALTAVEGQPTDPTVAIATFSDANLTAPTSDFSATIDWGDGTTAKPDVTAGTVVPLGGGSFEVTGTNTYRTAGTYSVLVTISDIGGSTATALSTATITDSPLSSTPESLNTLVEGGTFNGLLGTFTDPNTLAVPGDFIASVIWGDGNSGRVQVGVVTPGTFDLFGSNTYAEEGTYPVTVHVVDLGGSSTTINEIATVTDAPIVPVAGGPVTTTEGSTFSGVIGTFSESPNAPVSDFTVTITWGDRTASAGTVAAIGGGKFSVTGTHQYAEEGSFPIGITISDVGGSLATIGNTATVIDAALSSSAFGLTTLQGIPFSGIVAQLSDANAGAPVSDFSATINWGDGHVSSGQITALGGGQFQVTGSNTYATIGQSTILVTITDRGGSKTSASASANVLAALTGGLSSGGTVSNNTQPSFSGSAQPGTTVQLFAIPQSTGTPLFIGQAITDGTGKWSVTSIALAEGVYAITAQMLDTTGAVLQTIPLLSTPLVIDLTGPTVANVVLDPATSQLKVTFQDNLSGVNPGTLLAANNITLRLVSGRSPHTFTPTKIALVPGSAANQVIAVLSYNLPAKKAGTYVVTISALGVTDRAGNTLVETTFVTFPQTTNSPNPNYVAQIVVDSSGHASGPEQYISRAERLAAARYARLVRLRTRTLHA